MALYVVSMRLCCVFQTAIGEFTFILFMILMIGFTLFVFFKVPETKNRTFEEIASLFAPGGTIEVEEMVDDPVVAYSANRVVPSASRTDTGRKALTLDRARVPRASSFSGASDSLRLVRIAC